MGKKGGRPKKVEKHSRQVSVRLTEAQFQALRTRAVGSSVSAYIRSAALSGNRQAIRIPALNRDAWIELSRTAANLNQLTHHANQGHWGTLDELAGALSALSRKLDRVRHALIGGHHGNR